MSYLDEISDLISKVPTSIVDVNEPRKRGRAPSQAFSEFLTNREQGDWAEGLIQRLVNESSGDYTAVKYGRSDDIVAGDAEFREFYEGYQDELDSIGKKPDLLLFGSGFANAIGLDISTKSHQEQSRYIEECRAGFEVRSSAFLVTQYEEFLKTRERKGRDFLSFTPKAEDVMVIYKWIENFNVPHYYIQVFFDRIYMIPFKRILEIITKPTNLNRVFYIEENAKNQFKSTVHIDIDCGVCLSEKVRPPDHHSRARILPRGRVLYHVTFSGGDAEFDKRAFLDELGL